MNHSSYQKDLKITKYMLEALYASRPKRIGWNSRKKLSSFRIICLDTFLKVKNILSKITNKRNRSINKQTIIDLERLWEDADSYQEENISSLSAKIFLKDLIREINEKVPNLIAAIESMEKMEAPQYFR